MRLFLDYLLLCFFENNPNELFPTKSFIWKCVVFYLISGTIVEANISDPADGSLEVAMRTVVAVTTIAGTLLFIKQWSRFAQLLTAIFMCENVMMTLGIGTEILDYVLHKTQYEQLAFYLGAALVFWYMAVLAYILRQMFNYTTAASLILAFFYFGMTYGLPFLVMEVI